MPERLEQHHSHLFTLRLWAEALDGQETELRGVALHVRTGARITVRDWPALQAFFAEHISGDSVLPLQLQSGDGPVANE